MEWLSTRDHLPDTGTVCEVRCSDVLGEYDVPGLHILHDDGNWYRIDPPTLINAKVTSWRYADVPEGEWREGR